MKTYDIPRLKVVLFSKRRDYVGESPRCQVPEELKKNKNYIIQAGE